MLSIISAVRHRPPQLLDEEVVPPPRSGGSLGTPRPPAVLEVAYKLLLLGVHRDHRLAGRQRCLDLGINEGELRIPIRVAQPLAGLGVGLQTEAEPVQQLAHQRAADLMALGLKLVGKPAQALAGPAQRPLWIATRARLDQSLQIAHQVGISLDGRLAAAACATDATSRKGPRRGPLPETHPKGRG